MTQDELKHAVAKAAFDYVESKLEDDMILGVAPVHRKFLHRGAQ